MKDLFEQISKEYEDPGFMEVHHNGAFGVLHKKFYQGLSNKRILDVGNGGEAPKNVLGGAIPGIFFVGIDTSISMLKRQTGEDYMKIVGDGGRLPFKDKAFDIVLLNGVIHHLGLRKGEDQQKKIRDFFMELRRVASEKIIVYEITVPGFFEILERILVAVAGSMTEFVLSKKTLLRVLQSMPFKLEKWVSYSTMELTSPWHCPVLIMRLPWLRVPAFLSPINNHFFSLSV